MKYYSRRMIKKQTQLRWSEVKKLRRVQGLGEAKRTMHFRAYRGSHAQSDQSDIRKQQNLSLVKESALKYQHAKIKYTAHLHNIKITWR